MRGQGIDAVRLELEHAEQAVAGRLAAAVGGAWRRLVRGRAVAAGGGDGRRHRPAEPQRKPPPPAWWPPWRLPPTVLPDARAGSRRELRMAPPGPPGSHDAP